MHNLHHQLLRLDGIDYVLSESLGFHRIGESLGNLIVDIGIKKGATNILKGLGDIYLCDFTLAFEYLETPFELLT